MSIVTEDVSILARVGERKLRSRDRVLDRELVVGHEVRDDLGVREADEIFGATLSILRFVLVGRAVAVRIGAARVGLTLRAGVVEDSANTRAQLTVGVSVLDSIDGRDNPGPAPVFY